MWTKNPRQMLSNLHAGNSDGSKQHSDTVRKNPQLLVRESPVVRVQRNARAKKTPANIDPRIEATVLHC